MKWCDFTSWLFHPWTKLNGLTILFDHSNETSFAVLLFVCATDTSLFVRLQNTTKILVLGPHLCSRIWVCTMIGLLKKPLLICQSDWTEIWNAFLVIHLVRWGPRTTISALLPTHLHLWHRLCFCIGLFIMLHKVVLAF